MAVLPIITGADAPVLRTKTKKVPKVTKELLALIKDMEETTKASDGLGLAAPQVNQSLRLCLARLNGRLTPLINPEIFWKSTEIEVAEEGCLSLPNLWMNVPRSKSIAVRYLNAKGQEQERKLTDLEARIVQHEVDHLEGILITDYKDTLPHQAL
jgi:peptide deformylase